MEIPAYLLEDPASAVPPPASTTIQLLPFEDLSWQDFERLCLRLMSLEGEAEEVRLFGRPGEPQEGIDIYGRKKNGRYIVLQCRRRKVLTPHAVKQAIDEFISGQWSNVADEFVICTSADGSSTGVLRELEKQVSLLRDDYPSLSVTLRDRHALSLKLKTCPDVVRDFFGPAWLDRFIHESPPIPVDRGHVLPRMHELSWREVGVRRAGRACSDSGWTPKLERPLDSKVRALLRRAVKPPNQGEDAMHFILLVGEAGAGKTRALFDAANSVCPSALVYKPKHADPIELAATLDRGDFTVDRGDTAAPLLLWLDDLELFVPPDESGLTPARLNSLRQSSRRIVVLATAGGKAADIARARRGANFQSDGTVFSLILEESAVQLRVAAKGVTAKAVKESVATGDYHEDDAKAIQEHGIGPFVLGADLLTLKFHTGRFPPEEPPSLSGKAVVAAALAWSACGILRPLARDRLRQLWEHYFQGEPSAEEFMRGLEWAQEPVLGGMALIEREDSDYRCNDLVVASQRDAMKKADYLFILQNATPSEAAWVPYLRGQHRQCIDALKEFLDEREPLDDQWWPFQVAMGHVWRSLDQPERARESWEKGLQDGCYCAATFISRMKSDEGDIEGAASALQTLLDSGIGDVAVKAFLLYEKLGDKGKAVAALERGAEVGDGESAYVLGYTLRVSDPEGSARTFQRALDLGFGRAWIPLADHYVDQKEFEALEKVTEQAMELGIGPAATALGLVRQNRLDDIDGAIEAYRRGCDLEDGTAYAFLGRLYSERGQKGDESRAIDVLSAGTTFGSSDSAHMLGHLLEKKGDAEGAVEAFEEAIILGGLQPALCLAGFAGPRDLASARDRAILAAQSQPKPSILLWLSIAVDSVDGPEAARSAWQQLLDSGDREAIYLAGLYLRDVGRAEGAEKMLLEADELEFPAAACALGHIWEDLGDEDLARDAGLRAQALGHDCILGR